MENKFAKGIFIKERKEKTPDFVVAEMSVRPHDFFMWCQEHQNSFVKGWLNIKMLKPKNGGKYYIEVDNYKKLEVDSNTGEVIPDLTSTPHTVENTSTTSSDNSIDLSSIPF